MYQISDRLFVGNDSDCLDHGPDWVIVHACKHRCHQNAVGYSGSLPSNHPHYLALGEESDLYLNMIDPPQPLFPDELFTRAMDFMARHYNDGKNVLVHCNQGRSRAPSLVLLFLAGVTEQLPLSSYTEARTAFEKLYPAYDPGKGIQIKLKRNWDDLLST